MATAESIVKVPSKLKLSGHVTHLYDLENLSDGFWVNTAQRFLYIHGYFYTDHISEEMREK